jgi:hypothetical protein
VRKHTLGDILAYAIFTLFLLAVIVGWMWFVAVISTASVAHRRHLRDLREREVAALEAIARSRTCSEPLPDSSPHQSASSTSP